MRTLIAVCLLVCVAAAQPAAWETKCELRAIGQAPRTITLYADGRLAKADAEPGTSRWQWTSDGLWLKWYSGRVLLKPVPGERSLLRGRRMNVAPGTAAPAQELRVLEPDRAGVLAWLEPIIDGVEPSAVERQADRAARAIVGGQMAKQWARVEAAERKLDGALAALDKAERETAAKAGNAARDKASLSRAGRKAREANRKVIKRTNPYYSAQSFANALEERSAWENRRSAAEWNLAHNQAALEHAKDRRQKAAAAVRQAGAQYDVAAADYWIEFTNRWRPTYAQRKVAFKAEATRIAAEAEARKAEETARQAAAAEALRAAD